MAAEDPELQLAHDIGGFYDKPLDFVMYAYPWDTDKSIQIVKLESPYRERFGCEFGPDRWACEFLDQLGADIRERGFDGVTPVKPIQYAVSSGHGIGKSAMAAWLTHFIMSTRPHSRGVITANTAEQLASKTWAGVSAWVKRSVNAHWFTITTGKGAMKMVHRDHPDTWRVDAQTSREENSESFAGLHAASSTPWYLFDEASAIPPKIWEVSEGGKTDGEPMHFAFGNPTRNTGSFAECFGKNRHRWRTWQIDSRRVQITNKDKIAEWVADYGEDSDFVRVRVRGIFPRASSMQFIGRDLVDGAMTRDMALYQPHTRVALVGVDVARFGDDESTIYTRLQRDARTVPPKAYRELDTMQLAARVGEHVNELKSLGLQVIVFVDGGGVGGGVIDRLRQLQHEVIEVDFGGKADDPRKYRDKSAEMWDRAKAWLATGYLPEPDSEYGEQLATDLTGREYGYNDASQITMERKEHMKERGLASPDHADGLCLTFAHPAMELTTAADTEAGKRRAHSAGRKTHNPFDRNRLRLHACAQEAEAHSTSSGTRTRSGSSIARLTPGARRCGTRTRSSWTRSTWASTSSPTSPTRRPRRHAHKAPRPQAPHLSSAATKAGSLPATPC